MTYVVQIKNMTTGQFHWSDPVEADSVVDALKSALESAQEAEKTKRFGPERIRDKKQRHRSGGE
ncbi:hypothetical protein LCGC14_0897430 [marine sediment metagenome]|uniref:Uncharacterized protein n=1 Tax=marine sediment metagenome TaxID=412755 RepID=A0A0F9PI63_9ZZZZ